MRCCECVLPAGDTARCGAAGMRCPLPTGDTARCGAVCPPRRGRGPVQCCGCPLPSRDVARCGAAGVWVSWPRFTSRTAPQRPRAQSGALAAPAVIFSRSNSSAAVLKRLLIGDKSKQRYKTVPAWEVSPRLLRPHRSLLLPPRTIHKTPGSSARPPAPGSLPAAAESRSHRRSRPPADKQNRIISRRRVQCSPQRGSALSSGPSSANRLQEVSKRLHNRHVHRNVG